MNEQKNDKWLDELISGSINTQRPEFDAEKWKHKYPEQFQALQSRAAKASANSIQWTKIFINPITKFAAAAAVLVFGLAIGILMGWDTWQNQGIQSPGKSQMAQTEPTSLYNLDYLNDAPKGSLADAYLTLVSATNGREY